jgi:hypothetical protein
MKNRLFIIAMILVTVFLAILWEREQTYNARLKRIDAEVTAVEARVRLLRLKTRALKAEVELLDLSNQIKLLKGWNRHRSPVSKIPANSNRDGNNPGHLTGNRNNGRNAKKI